MIGAAVITLSLKGYGVSSFRVMFSGSINRRYLIIVEFDFRAHCGLPGSHQGLGPNSLCLHTLSLRLTGVAFDFYDKNEQQRCSHSYLLRDND